MVYAQVSASKDGDNVTNGAVYWGCSDVETAIKLFYAEFPQYVDNCWKIEVKLYN